MVKIIMVRHGQAEINKERRSGEIATAIGHFASPLTPRGIEQSVRLGKEHFPQVHGIYPEIYDEPVAASELIRTQQTLEWAGFRKIHVLPLLNELVPPPDLIEGRRAIEKHVAERWVPEDDGQIREFIDRIRSDHYRYSVYGAHGLVIAKVMMILESEVGLEQFPHKFDPARGYILPQAGSVMLDI